MRTKPINDSVGVASSAVRVLPLSPTLSPTLSSTLSATLSRTLSETPSGVCQESKGTKSSSPHLPRPRFLLPSPPFQLFSVRPIAVNRAKYRQIAVDRGKYRSEIAEVGSFCPDTQAGSHFPFLLSCLGFPRVMAVNRGKSRLESRKMPPRPNPGVASNLSPAPPTTARRVRARSLQSRKYGPCRPRALTRRSGGDISRLL
jgi:hypothetical protein